MKERIAIVDGLRSPFAKSGGAMRALQADDLGAYAVKELLARTEIPIESLDELIFGNVAQPIEAANVARIIAMKANLPARLPAVTVHRNCASGMESITTAFNKIHADDGRVFVCGGAESMSNIPFIFQDRMVELFMGFYKAKTLGNKLRTIARFRPKYLAPIIGIEKGLTDPICGLNMGKTAEILANEFQVDRDTQDTFARDSHRKAVTAQKAGRFADETFAIPLPPNYSSNIEADDGPREDQSLEKLGKLKPYFNRQTGTVTVGNACPITDGAAAILVMSEFDCKERGYTPLGYLKAFSYAGLEGSRMGLGPVYATAKLLDKTGMTMNDFDLIELNEAFAAQVVANMRAFGSASFARQHLNRGKAVGTIDPQKLNVNGGAIALGHPVGATGARLVITLLKELRRRGKKTGLATLCVGGGQGAALALEVA